MLHAAAQAGELGRKRERKIKGEIEREGESEWQRDADRAKYMENSFFYKPRLRQGSSARRPPARFLPGVVRLRFDRPCLDPQRQGTPDGGCEVEHSIHDKADQNC